MATAEYMREYRRNHPQMMTEIGRRYRIKHRAQKAASDARYRAQHRDENNALLKKWRSDHPEKTAQYYAKRRLEHRNETLENTRKWQEKLRNDVFSHYGMVCACCGEAHPEFLSIDHINGGGNKHRRELKCSGQGIYIWLRKNGYPDGFRTLCMNCNWASRGKNRCCPHQRQV